MERLQQVIAGVVLAAGAMCGGGCIHFPSEPKAKLPAPEKMDAVNADPAVQQASAKVPAPVPSASMAALAKAGASELPKGAATDIALAWQSRVAQLPDPTRNGALLYGVVGQMFLFAADSKVAPANGSLTVEMYDISAGAPEGKRLGTWTFEKDVLKRMATIDERFGKSYAIFLPWPEYDPNVSRVRLKARFDPERGYPLFSPDTKVTLDDGTNKTANHQKRTVTGGVDVAGFGGIPASPPPSSTMPALNPLPVGGRNAQSFTPPAAGTTALPPGLPPLVITPQQR